MNRFIAFVKIFQALACVYLVVISFFALYNLPNLHQIGMSSTEIHEWVLKGPKSEIEENIKLNHKALQASEIAFSLFVKYVAAGSIFNLGLVIIEYLSAIEKQKQAIS